MKKLFGVSVFVPDQENKKVLAVKRSAQDFIFPDMWALPGGEIEEGENFSQAAEREMLEEVGLLPKIVTPEPLLQSQIGYQDFLITLYLIKAQVNREAAFSPKDKDISTVCWLDPARLLSSVSKKAFPEEEVEKLRKLFSEEKIL